MFPRSFLKRKTRSNHEDTLPERNGLAVLLGEHGTCRATKQHKQIVMNKSKSSAPPGASGNAAPTDQPTFRTNPEVDAKIDAYIKENPKYWAYVQAMPRERLDRTVALHEVRELDRQQRIR